MYEQKHLYANKRQQQYDTCISFKKKSLGRSIYLFAGLQ